MRWRDHSFPYLDDLMAAAATNANLLTLTVKLMNGELLCVDIPRDSKLQSHDLPLAIQRAIGIPHFYQKIFHIDPDTNEPYTKWHAYTETSILLLFVSPAEVYIKHEEIYRYPCPLDNTPIESIRYSINIYHDKMRRDSFSFLVNRHGFYLFSQKETHSTKPWSEYILRRKLRYIATLEETLQSMSPLIRDETLRKWKENDILPSGERLPYAHRYDDEEEYYDYE